MKKLIRDTITHWRSHNAPRMGAALSYYAMLSFVPLTLLLITLASYLFSRDIVQGTLITELGNTIGRSAAQYIDELLRSQTSETISITTALIGAGITIIGAIGVFGELDQDFDILWDTPTQPSTKTTFWKKVARVIQSKIVAFSLVPLLALILLVSIGVTVFFGALQDVVRVAPAFVSLINLLQLLAPLGLGTILFAVIYRILPNRKLPWRIIFFGAFITALLFIIGNFLILQYIRFLVHTDVFGSAASLVGLLVWVYYSAQVFFLGASFTYVYAKKKGLIASRD